MFHRLFILFLLVSAAGCSSPQPPAPFLNAPMRVISVTEGKAQASLLKIKPIDFTTIFDTNVTKKKWKKIHENSWSYTIFGKNPSSKASTKMTITLSRDPRLNNDVVINKISVNKFDFTPDMVAEEMIRLDQAYSSR